MVGRDLFKKLALALAFALVMGCLGLIAPALTFAATNPPDPDGNPYTGILAGRPVNGWAYNGYAGTRPYVYDVSVDDYRTDWGMGHGIAYAKVGGSIVLLYPFHGMNNNAMYGKDVYGPNESRIGYYWGTNGGVDTCYAGDCASYHDLAVIMLYQGNWPANLNRIYRGTQGSGDPYWTITDNPVDGLTCDTVTVGRAVYHNFQNDPSTFWSYRSGAITSVNPNTYGCTVTTNLYAHAHGQSNCAQAVNFCSRDSGSPWVAGANIHTVFGISSAATNGGLDYLIVTPLYEGMHVLYQYWQSQGSTAGICKTSTC